MTLYQHAAHPSALACPQRRVPVRTDSRVPATRAGGCCRTPATTTWRAPTPKPSAPSCPTWSSPRWPPCRCTPLPPWQACRTLALTDCLGRLSALMKRLLLCGQVLQQVCVKPCLKRLVVQHWQCSLCNVQQRQPPVATLGTPCIAQSRVRSRRLSTEEGVPTLVDQDAGLLRGG